VKSVSCHRGRFSFGIVFKIFSEKMKLMEQQKNDRQETNKEIDVTRSEHQQAQQAANKTGEEERAEGAKDKGNPPHQHGAHQEGQYQQQSDDATMHPSDIDEDK